MSTASILPRLEGLPKAKAHKSGWMACCPAHEDAAPSLSWTDGKDGRIVIRCHAGCTAEQVVAALGMTMADLFAPTLTTVNRTFVASKPDAGPASSTRRFAAFDVDGGRWTHVRREDLNGRKVGNVWWDPSGVQVARLLPFGCEHLAGWVDPVVMVEGEATAAALHALDIPAVATFGIDYHPEPAALASLAGRRILLWPDADADPGKGRAHMLDMATRLAGIAASVEWIEPPTDVFDGWDAADADRDTIARMIASPMPVPTPPSVASERDDDDDDGGRRRRPSAADLIVQLATDRYDLGRAEDGEPFAIERDGPNVARMFRGGRASLRSSLAAAFAATHGKVPPAQGLVDALAVLEGQALGMPRKPLPIRASRINDETVVIDLGDEAGRAILVETRGWSIVSRSPVTFRRSELTGTLPIPVAGTIDALRSAVNVSPADLPIVLAQLVAALLGVPVPIVLLRGPAGAAKTTAARLLATTIDPSPAPVRSVPRDPEAWAVTAGGSFVVVLDNIDVIPAWLSDALCRAVTGEGYLRRALYTDGAIAVVSFRRAIYLTAIDPGAMRGDLSDRLVTVDLLGIPEHSRRDDAAVNTAFSEAHPAILGGLLDLIAKVLVTLPTINLARRPRMADYGRVLAAVDAVLGTSALPAYMDQRGELQREAAEGDRIGAAVISFMVARTSWDGTAGELLTALSPDRPPKDWPATGRALAGSLRRLVAPLAAAGVNVTFVRVGHDRTRIITLEQVGDGSSASSASSAGPDPSTDHGVAGADGMRTQTPDADANGQAEDAQRPHVLTLPEHDADDADDADGIRPSVLGRVPSAGQPCPVCSHPMVEVPGRHPICTNAPGHPRRSTMGMSVSEEMALIFSHDDGPRAAS